MHFHENTLFDPDLGVNVDRHVLHLTYSGTKFEDATSNGLRGDAFTRNETDGRTHRRTTDRLWYEINLPFWI